jgi:hypothetical protein
MKGEDMPKKKKAKKAADALVFRLPEAALVNETAQHEGQEASKALEFIEKSFEIKTDIELQTAVSMIAEAKDKHSEVDEKRRGFLEGANNWIKMVNGAMRPALGSLVNVEKALKAKVAEHVKDRESRRDELLATAGEASREGDEEMAKTALVKADEATTPKVDGLSLRESWQVGVTDPVALISWCVAEGQLQFVVPNEKALKAHVKAVGRDPQIPGLLAQRDVGVAVTVDKVRRV